MTLAPSFAAMYMKHLLFPLAVLLVGCAGAGPSGREFARLRHWERQMATPDGRSNVVSAVMNSAADPCDDFYEFACGGWLSEVTIPAGYQEYTRGFLEVSERNTARLWKIIQEGAPQLSPVGRRTIATYFDSCMDWQAREQAGVAPLGPFMEAIDRAADLAALVEAAADLHKMFVWPFFSVNAAPDPDDPKRFILVLRQAGIGFKDPRTYLRQEYYVRAIERMFVAIGEDPAHATQKAHAVASFEEAIRMASWLPSHPDPAPASSKVTYAELVRLTPNFPWPAYFQAAGISEPEALLLEPPIFFSEIDELLSRTLLQTVKDYLRWRLLEETAALLSPALADILNPSLGRLMRQEGWRVCLDETALALGDLLGEALSKDPLFEEGTRLANEIWRETRNQAVQIVAGADWLPEPTRRHTLEKIESTNLRLGYPRRWLDYETQQLSDDYFDNVVRVRRARSEVATRLPGTQLRPEYWSSALSTVSAYYVPNVNLVLVPIGIVQPPFVGPNFPPAMNFAGIGFVIGHELGHGLDTNGIQYDATGKRRERGEESSRRVLQERTQCLRDRYDRWKAPFLERIHPVGDPARPINEMIADQVGIAAAHRAFKQRSTSSEEQTAGLTEDQLFFVAFAQAWCAQTTSFDDEYKIELATHAPARFRIESALANMPAFAEAFSCRPESRMRAIERCEVW